MTTTTLSLSEIASAMLAEGSRVRAQFLMVGNTVTLHGVVQVTVTEVLRHECAEIGGPAVHIAGTDFTGQPVTQCLAHDTWVTLR